MTTTANTSEVAAAVGAKPPDRPKPPPSPHQRVADWLEFQKPQIARALGSRVDADQFAMFALTAIRKTPKLIECTPDSMLAALMVCAQINLEPGPFGYVYLTPRNRKVQGQWVSEVQMTIGYKGYIELARRSGLVKEVYAHVVHAHDEFAVKYGVHRDIVHVPNLTSDRGDVVGAYAVVHYTNGGFEFVYLTRAEIDKRRAASDSGTSEYGPWVNWFESMARKSAVRDLANFLPLTAEAQQAIALDEQVQQGVGSRLFERDGEPYDERGVAEALAAAPPSEHDAPLPANAVEGSVVPPPDGSLDSVVATQERQEARQAAPEPASASRSRRGRQAAQDAPAGAVEPPSGGWPPVAQPGGGL